MAKTFPWNIEGFLLSNLMDVDFPTAPVNGQAIIFDGPSAKFKPMDIPPGGTHAIGSHTDVIGTPSEGNVLVYDSGQAAYVPQPPPAGSESDPVFLAAPAGGIVSQDILDWDEAHGWGDHAGLYSAVGHNHDSAYSLLTHDHDADYADILHDHDADYAPIGHNHDSAYAALGHNHDAVYSLLGHGHAQLHDRQHSITAVADHSFPGGATFLRADGVFAAPGGGSDPWTVVKLAADFPSSLAANTPVPGLFFTPAAGKTYAVYGAFLLRTGTATVGARPGIAWPTVADGGAWIDAPNSLTAAAMRIWGARTAQNAASTGLADTASSHYSKLEALIVSGPTPSGSFQVTLASETGGTAVTMKAGSYIMYREI